MKTKDIRDRLRGEMDEIVPDVLPKIKAVPINKLLTADTGVQVFRKKLATNLLLFTLAIFVGMSVALSAFFFMPKENSPAAGTGYISVEIDTGESILRYGIVEDKNGVVSLIFDESNSVCVEIPTSGKTADGLIALLPDAAWYSVRIAVLNDSLSYARSLAHTLGGLASSQGGENINVDVAICQVEDELRLVAWINDADPDAGADITMDIEKLALLYAETALKLS